MLVIEYAINIQYLGGLHGISKSRIAFLSLIKKLQSVVICVILFVPLRDRSLSPAIKNN